MGGNAMAAIYSTQLAAGSQASGTTSVVYTVPAGFVAVIRDIVFGAQSPPANSVASNIAGVAEIYSVDTVTQYRTAHSEMRVVVNAGQSINVDAIAGTWSYIISGYLLTI
jgi:hypothetical protein